MNALVKLGEGPATMDSKNLLDLINAERKKFGEPEVRHNQFVDRCRDELDGEHYKSFVVTNPNGTTSDVVEMTIDQCMLVAMRESKGVRRSVQAKLKSLQQAQFLIPQTYAEAMRLAADEIEKREAAETQLAIAAPKAAALDRIATETEGAVCLRIAAKMAQVPEKQYLQFLSGEKWIFRHHHSQTWAGYSEKEQAGYLELKRTRVTRDDGSEKTVEQVLITPRGQAKAAELIERKAPWLKRSPVAGAVMRATPSQSRGQRPQAGAQL